VAGGRTLCAVPDPRGWWLARMLQLARADDSHRGAPSAGRPRSAAWCSAARGAAAGPRGARGLRNWHTATCSTSRFRCRCDARIRFTSTCCASRFSMAAGWARSTLDRDRGLAAFGRLHLTGILPEIVRFLRKWSCLPAGTACRSGPAKRGVLGPPHPAARVVREWRSRCGCWRAEACTPACAWCWRGWGKAVLLVAAVLLVCS